MNDVVGASAGTGASVIIQMACCLMCLLNAFRLSTVFVVCVHYIIFVCFIHVLVCFFILDFVLLCVIVWTILHITGIYPSACYWLLW